MEIIKFVEFINTNQPFIFAKFGDGEYFAATKAEGGNCDGTPYTEKLSEGIIQSFKYLTNHENVYIARWAERGVDTYFQSLTDTIIKWTDYNIFIFKSLAQYFGEQQNFYKAIKNYSKQKIYICNQTMVDFSRNFLNIDDFVVVDSVNWFDNNYSDTLNQVIRCVKDPNEVMILSSAGMGAKVLIADIHRIFPNSFIIDIGSALDLVCSGRRTRDFHHNFSMEDISQIRNSLL